MGYTILMILSMPYLNKRLQKTHIKNHINKNESSNNLKRTFPEQNVEEQITNEIITSNNDDFSHEEHMPNVFTNITQYKEEESSKVASKEDNQIKKRKKHKNRKRKK